MALSLVYSAVIRFCSYSIAPVRYASSASSSALSSSFLASATLSSVSFKILSPAVTSSPDTAYTSSISRLVVRFSTSKVSSVIPTLVTPDAAVISSVKVNPDILAGMENSDRLPFLCNITTAATEPPPSVSTSTSATMIHFLRPFPFFSFLFFFLEKNICLISLFFTANLRLLFRPNSVVFSSIVGFCIEKVFTL